jgi:hypothetical protein
MGLLGGKPVITTVDAFSANGYPAEFKMNGSATVQVVVDRVSLHAVKLDHTSNWAGSTTEVHVRYGSDNHVMGSIKVPPSSEGTQSGSVDTALAAQVMDGHLFYALMEALPLAAGARFSVTLYNVLSGVETTTWEVTDGGSVTVPAGTFDCWKIDPGPGLELAYYVAKSPRRLIMKVNGATVSELIR